MRSLLPMPILLLAGATAQAADDVTSGYWVRVMPSAWFAAFDGDASYTAGGLTGDRLSLDQLDLANQEVGIGVEVGAKLPILFSFHAGGFGVGTDGSFSAANVDFGGETFNGTVDTSIDLSDLYIEADLRLLDLDIAGVAIGLGYHAMSTSVSLSGGGTSAKLDEDLQFPVVALRAHANVPVLLSLGAEAKIHWMEIGYLDNDVSYLDATLQVTWRPWSLIGFIAGYRHIVAEIGFDEPAGTNASAEVEATLSGPFLGLTAQF
jgi:hypothetical protein